jgi:hypothetical protein
MRNLLKIARKFRLKLAVDEYDEYEEEHHDPNDGVIDQGDYDFLSDKKSWLGYKYYIAIWRWDAANYENQDEPDDWGDNTYIGPILTLDAVLAALSQTPFKKWQDWITIEDGSFESIPKKSGKFVIQGVANIERVDGKPLSYAEQKYIQTKLKFKRKAHE